MTGRLPLVARCSGRALASWQPAREYGFADADGTRPDWGRYFEEAVEGGRPPQGDYR